MNIRNVTEYDIPKWKKLSHEYDEYVLELVSDLTEWYDGNGSEGSLSFDSYMDSKIKRKEAFIAVDNNDNCLGIIAFSYRRNYITFLGVSENMDVKNIGDKLLSHAFTLMENHKPIFINESDSKSDRIRQHIELLKENNFVQNGKTLENGVPVNIFVKSPN